METEEGWRTKPWWGAGASFFFSSSMERERNGEETFARGEEEAWEDS